MLDSLCYRLGVRHRLSTAYHPQTNGLVERFNRTLCEMLAKYSNEWKQDWDMFLPSALFAYRTLRQNTTRYEPFYLTYGRDATLPIEFEIKTYPTEEIKDQDFEKLYFNRLEQIMGVLQTSQHQARTNIEVSQQKQVERHEKKLVNHQYHIGDKVLLKNFRIQKLAPKWNGPYYIHDINCNGTYKLRTLDGKVRKKLVHADQIVPYHEQIV
jgi:hypothetical protein